MSLEKASISWSAKQLKNMIHNGKIDFNHIIQRSYVWERKRKSALIESMIIGYPIPAVFAKRVDDGTGKRGGNIYSIMDGKQRLSTVAQYLNDEFALTELPPVSYMDEAFGGECETIYTVSKDRLGDFVRTCTDEEMARIEKAMSYSLGIKPVPHVPQENLVEDSSAIAVERNLYKNLYEQLLNKVVSA